MKTILIVGTGIMQVTLAKRAKAIGYRLVMCSEDDKGPAAKYADKFYRVSVDDKEAVLKVAREEKVGGVISNSPLVMTTVAYVADKLGLVGNPVSAIEILEAKIPFRKLQEKLGLYAPKCRTVSGCWSALWQSFKLKFPIMVKPDLAAGTEGQVKLESRMQLLKLFRALKRARRNSPNGKVCIEEFVTNRDKIALETEVCLYGGQYLWDGVYSVTRSGRNPLLVNSDIFPHCLSDKELETLKEAVKKIFNELGIVHGQYNLEGFFTKEGELFILEINPRQAGDEMASLVEYTTGVDLNRLLLETAMGDFCYLKTLDSFERRQRFAVRHRVFADKTGFFKGVTISPDMKGRIIERHEVPIGSRFARSKTLSSSVAYYIIEFDSKKDLYDTALRLEDLIIPIIE